MTRFAGMIGVVCLIGAQVAFGIDYKKNVISGAGGTTRSTFQSFSSSTTIGLFILLACHFVPAQVSPEKELPTLVPV